MSDSKDNIFQKQGSLESFLLKVFSEKRLLELLAVLIELKIKDPDELRKMSFNWKYNLSREKVLVIEKVARGEKREVMAEEFHVDKKTIARWLKNSMEKLNVTCKEQLISLAGRYGIGQKGKN